MAHLSLCMIARDEERLLPGCLESVKGLVQEVVLVDTGSTDATREIAVRLGARVYDRPWDDDFSAPRNLAISHARGDWVLVLDADERLLEGGARAIRRAMQRDEIDLGLLRLHDASRADAAPAEVVSGAARIGPPARVPRLLRRTPDLEYRGVVHESVEDWLARRGMRLAELDADILHLGAIPDRRAALGKRRRNLELLEKRCRLEPGSVVPLGYLAMERWRAGEVDGARVAAERAWALLDAQPLHRSAHLAGMARAFCQAEAGDAAGLRATVERLARREGLNGDYAFLLALAEELEARRAEGAPRRRALESALEMYRKALGAGAPLEGRHCIAGASSWGARIRAGLVLVALGRPEEALRELGAALAEVPGSAEARLGEVEALLEAGRCTQAMERVEPLLSGEASTPDAWTLAALCARASGSPGDARLLLARARERASGPWVAPHRAGRLAELGAWLASSGTVPRGTAP